MNESPVGIITEKVPLQNVAVDVLIRGFVGDVTSQLHYKNQESVPLEVEFVFPVHAEAAVYAFEGLMDGQKIEAQIMKREEARTAYETGLIMGSNVALLENDPKSKDIFSCMLGNLPPNGEATLKLCYVQAFSPEPDGAIRFVLPVVLRPWDVPQGLEEGNVSQSIPRVPKGQLPYTLSLNVTIDSSYRISHVESNCTFTPLQYTTEDHTVALISLVGEHHFDQDVELLIYYEEEVHKPNGLLEPGKPGADTGSLMGDPMLLLTMYPTLPPLKSALNTAGEFVFLVDCSGSMDRAFTFDLDSPSCIQQAKETLIFLLKSLPLGSYFNIYAFGSNYYSFFSQSVRYTQETMLKSVKQVKKLQANMGGTEILQPLKAIYSQPCQEGYICQLFIFTDGEVSNTMEVIEEVQSHSKSHRCFSFGIGEWVCTHLINGIAEAGCGHAKFIKHREEMQTKALHSMKQALQPKVNDICLYWDLPSGFEAVLVRPAPRVIFAGECCLIYAQISGQQQPSGVLEGSVVLQYKSECQIFRERMAFSPQLQKNDRFPIHRLAAQALLQDLKGATSIEKQNLALETSLSSGVLCDQTACVLVNTDLCKPLQTSVYSRRIPVVCPFNLGNRRLQLSQSMVEEAVNIMNVNVHMVLERDNKLSLLTEEPSKWENIKTRLAELLNNLSSSASAFCATGTTGWRNYLTPGDFVNAQSTSSDQLDQSTSESLLLKVVSLQNAVGSWTLDTCLLSLLGLNEAETLAKKPSQVAPAAWATVLVILWLHVHATEQRDIWELLEVKALGWLHENAGPELGQCIQIGNTFLGCSINPAVFEL